MRQRKRWIIGFTTTMALALIMAALATRGALAAGTTYYVDCAAGSDSNNGTSTSTAWRTLAKVTATTFTPGDSVLFKRGTTCIGQAWPKGSGSSGSPISLGAYGTGAQPIINGNNAVDPVVKLFNQQYWIVQDVEITGSTGQGLLISGSGASVLNYFRVINVNSHHHGIHDGQSAIVIGTYQLQSVNDVIVDNVIAHDAFRGIDIGGNCCNNPAIRSNNVTVRNSTVYNAENDGIFVFSTNNALLENNVAWNTGRQPVEENHTPNGIWTWDCDNCVVQFNEAYESHSPTWDGGGFDIDYFSHNTTVQYNYGHDNDGYCVGIFGGDTNDVTTNNVFRYNICANNMRGTDQKATRQGEIYVTIWSQGSVADTYVYNNTIYSNPATSSLGPYYAINQLNLWHGDSIDNTNYYNNIIYSAVPHLLYIKGFTSTTHMDYNLYWYTGAGNPSFVWGGSTYTSFAAWKTGSGQDANSLYTNPLLNNPTYHSIGKPTTAFTLQSGSPAINAGVNLVTLGIQPSMGTRDFFGNAIPQSGAFDIGAHESGGSPLPTNTPAPTATPLPTNTPGPSPTPVPTNTPAPTNTPLPGGTNLALNRPTTTSSVQSGDVGAFAVDGLTTTRWWALKNSTLPGEFITVDLGSATSISRVVLNQGDRWATAFTIQVSTDGTNWTTVASTTSGVKGINTLTFPAASARYVKMNSTAWFSSTDRIKLIEFQIFP
jgi:hypothetical protein